MLQQNNQLRSNIETNESFDWFVQSMPTVHSGSIYTNQLFFLIDSLSESNFKSYKIPNSTTASLLLSRSTASNTPGGRIGMAMHNTFGRVTILLGFTFVRVESTAAASKNKCHAIVILVFKLHSLTVVKLTEIN